MLSLSLMVDSLINHHDVANMYCNHKDLVKGVYSKNSLSILENHHFRHDERLGN